MEKGFKIRIYPNKTQTELINKTFGCARFIYNHFLNEKIELYENENKNLTYYDCSKLLTKLKSEKEWLKEPDKFALQNALKDLENAYKKFFKEKRGFPKFKSKKNRNQSYRTNFSNNNIEIIKNKIKLPKLGFVKFRGYKDIKGKILNVTISIAPSGKYYASVCCTDVQMKTFDNTNKNVGIDLGIKEFATLSDGTKIHNPKYLSQSLKKLKRLQKQLSRKTKGSSNWKKNRLKIARLHEYISNQRKDFLQKTTTKLIKLYDIIVLENLKISNMLKNHKLAKSISDVSWYGFFRILEYKAICSCKKIIKINTFYPSSQLCFSCGCINKEVKNLNIRTWQCPECGAIHDRDINAAQNILREGLRQII